MTTIKHRFLDHQINPQTETLVVGTFNPDAEDSNEVAREGGILNCVVWNIK